MIEVGRDVVDWGDPHQGAPCSLTEVHQGGVYA